MLLRRNDGTLLENDTFTVIFCDVVVVIVFATIKRKTKDTRHTFDVIRAVPLESFCKYYKLNILPRLDENGARDSR